MLILIRILGVVLLTTVCLPVLLVSIASNLLGMHSLGMRWAAHIQSLWSRLMLFTLGIRLDTEGKRPPLKAAILAANHLSYLDVLVLSALFPSRFIAKSEIAKWPGLGTIVAAAGTLFVKRGDRNDVPRVIEEMRRTLAAGVSVTFFPEGWASRGLSVRRFHPGLFQTAALGNFPCLPVTLSYSTPSGTFAPAWTVAWWGPVPIGPHLLRMLREGPVIASVRWAPEPTRGDDRKQLALGLQNEVQSRFVPMRQEPVPPPIKGDPGPEEGLEGNLPTSTTVTYT